MTRMEERLQGFTGMLSRTVVLVDNTPSDESGNEHTVAAVFGERVRSALRHLRIPAVRPFGGGDGQVDVVPDLGTNFREIARAPERPEHVIVVVNGRDGRHFHDPATEVAALDLLQENKEMMLDFVQVYGGDRQRAMRGTAESIGGLGRIFPPARPAPSYVRVPDPDALPREVLSLSLARRVAQLGRVA